MNVIIKENNEKNTAIFKDIDLLKHLYFCFDDKEAKNTLKREYKTEDFLEGNATQLVWRVEAIESEGYPSVTAFKVFNFFLNKISNLVYSKDGIPNILNFSIYEIEKELYGSCGGDIDKRVKQAIRQLTMTKIITQYTRIEKINEKDKKTHKELIWSIFSNCGFRGEEDQNSGKTYEESFIVLDPVMKKNLENGYFIAINYNKLNQIKTEIGQALYQRLEYIFYVAEHKEPNNKSITAKKNYQDICEKWLLIKKRNSISQARQQLDKHCKELVKVGSISDYDFYKSSNKEIIVSFTRRLIDEKSEELKDDSKLPKISDDRAITVEKILNNYKIAHPRKYKKFFQKATHFADNYCNKEKSPLFYESNVKIKLYEFICEEEGLQNVFIQK